MTRPLAVAAAALVLCGAVLGAGPQEARAADAPSWAYDLWHDLMSPYCPGRTLAECPSPSADELRIWILTQAAAGAEREEVEASLYARFGDQIRTTPKAEGWGLAAYAIPAVAFVLFGGVVLVVLRRLVAGSEPGGASDPRPSTPVVPVAAGAYSDAELERLVDEEFEA